MLQKTIAPCIIRIRWCSGSMQDSEPSDLGSLLTRAFTTRQIGAVKMCKLTVALSSRRLVINVVQKPL